MKRATPNLSVKLNRVIDPTDDATAIVFEPVQSITAIGYVSGKIRLFSEKLSTHVELGIERSSEIRHLVVLSSQPVVAAIDGLGTLWVFDTDIQRLCFSYNVPLAPTCVGLIADTSWLLIGTEAGRVYFVDVLEGKKSDFSIGCQIRPPSPVVSVAPHPLETEKLLIAYSEGTCVVCDLGKASGSEKAMVLTRHKYEHLQTQGETDGPASAADVDSGAAMLQTTQDGQRSQRDSVHGYANIGSELTSASWSPDGSSIAAAYTNGTLCIFSSCSSSRLPIAMRTIIYPDGGYSLADAVESRFHYLGNTRWCTLASTDRSFILVTFGQSRSSQRYINFFATGSGDAVVKSSNDVAPQGSFELGGAVESLCTLPQDSPWRNGNDSIFGVALVTRQRHHIVQALEIGPDIQLRDLALLPGEVVWCNYRPTAIGHSQDKTDLSIYYLLQDCLASKTSVPTDNTKAQMEDTVSIEQIVCTADTTETLRVWCNSNVGMDLAVCNDLVLNIEYLSRVLGIEHQTVSAIDLNTRNGMLSIGLNTGEILLCSLTDNPRLSVAQKCTPLDRIRELAQEFYAESREALLQKPNIVGLQQTNMAEANREDIPLLHPAPPCEPRSSQDSEASTGSNTKSRMRDRAISIHDGHFVHRSSKRLSASIGSLFRRGSTLVGGTTNSARLQPEISASNTARSSVHSMRSSYSAECCAFLPRPMEIHRDVWRLSQAKINNLLSHMTYGLCFSKDDIRCIGKTKSSYLLEAKKDPDMPATAADDERDPTDTQSKSLILPFMLARFYSSKVTDTVAGPNGIVAAAFEEGVVVVIDCIKQEVVLSDNINQTPTTEMNAKDIFRPSLSLPANGSTSIAPASITATSICELELFSDTNDQCSKSDGLVESLVIGTSLGYVLIYPIYRMEPPLLLAVRSTPDDPIRLVYADSTLRQPCKSITGPADNLEQSQAQDRILVIGSQMAITTHVSISCEPSASYTLATEQRRFIAANVVTLSSGWHGVTAIDNSWNIILLSLPNLNEDAVIDVATKDGPLPLLTNEIKSEDVDIQISSTGNILIAGGEGRMIQMTVVDSEYRSPAGATTSSFYSGRQTCFDIALQPSPLPARKGITSWLFGKSASASCDITGLLGGHARNLIVNGATRPGESFRNKEPLPDEALVEVGSSGMSKRTDSKIESIIKDTELGSFSEMKILAERRGQQLEDVGDRARRMTAESQKFLENIRAYNAKQEKKQSKRFGLF